MNTGELRRLHVQYVRPAKRGLADFCAVCDEEGWPCTVTGLLDRIDALERALGEVAELRRLALSTRPIVKANNRAAIHEHLGDLEEAAARAALLETP